MSSQGKKRHLPIACDACSESHLKCDGYQPCSRCAHTGKACTYPRRGRTTIACVWCSAKHRRCGGDGINPCNYCIQHQLECRYGSASTVMPTPARTATTKTLTRVEVPEPWEQNSQSSLFVLPLASLRHDRISLLYSDVLTYTNAYSTLRIFMGNVSINITQDDYKNLLAMQVTPKTAFAYASLSLGALLMEDKDRSYSLVNSAKKILDALGPNNSFVASCAVLLVGVFCFFSGIMSSDYLLSAAKTMEDISSSEAILENSFAPLASRVGLGLLTHTFHGDPEPLLYCSKVLTRRSLQIISSWNTCIQELYTLPENVITIYEREFFQLAIFLDSLSTVPSLKDKYFSTKEEYVPTPQTHFEIEVIAAELEKCIFLDTRNRTVTPKRPYAVASIALYQACRVVCSFLSGSRQLAVQISEQILDLIGTSVPAPHICHCLFRVTNILIIYNEMFLAHKFLEAIQRYEKISTKIKNGVKEYKEAIFGTKPYDEIILHIAYSPLLVLHKDYSSTWIWITEEWGNVNRRYLARIKEQEAYHKLKELLAPRDQIHPQTQQQGQQQPQYPQQQQQQQPQYLQQQHQPVQRTNNPQVFFSQLPSPQFVQQPSVHSSSPSPLPPPTQPQQQSQSQQPPQHQQPQAQSQLAAHLHAGQPTQFQSNPFYLPPDHTFLPVPFNFPEHSFEPHWNSHSNTTTSGSPWSPYSPLSPYGSPFSVGTSPNVPNMFQQANNIEPRVVEIPCEGECDGNSNHTLNANHNFASAPTNGGERPSDGSLCNNSINTAVTSNGSTLINNSIISNGNTNAADRKNEANSSNESWPTSNFHSPQDDFFTSLDVTPGPEPSTPNNLEDTSSLNSFVVDPSSYDLDHYFV